MNLVGLVTVSVFIVGTSKLVNSAASDYFRLCHQSEANFSECIKKGVRDYILRHKNGIPEIGLPPLDPFSLPLIQFYTGAGGSGGFTNLTKNVVYGMGDTEITDVVARLTKKAFLFRVKFRTPNIRIEGTYDVDSKILFLDLKGHGPYHINASDVLFEMAIRSEKVLHNGSEYFKAADVTGAMEITKAHMILEGLFKDPALTRATNDILNENFHALFDDIKPSLVNALFDYLKGLVSKAESRFTVSELFPK